MTVSVARHRGKGYFLHYASHRLLSIIFPSKCGNASASAKYDYLQISDQSLSKKRQFGLTKIKCCFVMFNYAY